MAKKMSGVYRGPLLGCVHRGRSQRIAPERSIAFSHFPNEHDDDICSYDDAKSLRNDVSIEC